MRTIDPERVLLDKVAALQQIILLGLLLGRELTESAANAANTLKPDMTVLWHNIVGLVQQYDAKLSDARVLSRQLTELSVKEWELMDEWCRHVINIPPATIHPNEHGQTIVDRTLEVLLKLRVTKEVYAKAEKYSRVVLKLKKEAPYQMLGIDAKAYAIYVKAGCLVPDLDLAPGDDGSTPDKQPGEAEKQ
jgi:hypothetical protein